MNQFRDKVLSGRPLREPLLRNKAFKEETSSAGERESFADLNIPRSETRLANHRDLDRHRLDNETATVVFDGGCETVLLVNLSGGGAMIEGANDLKLWDRIELQFGECSPLEAIVRWIKGDRIGLEFAHETRIDTGSEQLAETLRAVISRSFPDIALEVAATAAAMEQKGPAPALVSHEDKEPDSERELRHPLIWTGLVYFNHDSTPVRLRNISSGGALIESSGLFPVGSELLLDLGEAGSIFASVHWARGDQAGLKFHAPYDVSALANARPEVAGARWTAPDYLREDRSSSPWASQWGRSDLGNLHRALEATRAAIKRR